MSTLIHCAEVTRYTWDRPLFEGITLSVDEGARMGIIGPNGSGKTTLLGVMAGDLEAEEGRVLLKKDLRLAFVPQQNDFDLELSVGEALRERIRQSFEYESEVEHEVRLNKMLSRMGFEDPEAPANTLSGGWQRRLTLGRALIVEPELLLLDEPTNHLDLEGILWLEKVLKDAPFSFVMVSHDRTFLENTVNQVVELDRRFQGGMFTCRGGWREFVEKREQFLVGRQATQESLSKKLDRELQWLAQGPKARTSKSSYRIEAVKTLQQELSKLESNSRTENVDLAFSATQRRTRRLLAATDLGVTLGGRNLFRKLRLLLTPKLRLGLVGPNGSGKTTLLEILAGCRQPDEGQIQRAPNLRIVYFDQNREQLDPRLSLREALVESGDLVHYQGRAIHVVSWAQRFLFRPEQLSVELGRMSGGEQARVLIARLMQRPADLLVLDEPTNDLDIPTLEVLEQSLLEFEGALVFVTHDRTLLDRVSSLLLALDGDGGWNLFADWQQWESSWPAKDRKPKRDGVEPQKSRPKAQPQKLSYREEREYRQLSLEIEEAESQLSLLQLRLEEPALASDAEALASTFESIQGQEEDLLVKWGRFEELEAKKRLFKEQ